MNLLKNKNAAKYKGILLRKKGKKFNDYIRQQAMNGIEILN